MYGKVPSNRTRDVKTGSLEVSFASQISSKYVPLGFRKLEGSLTVLAFLIRAVKRKSTGYVGNLAIWN